MREISFIGIKGRKKAKRLLMAIITLTFTFIVLSTTLVSSMEESKRRQREELFGSWQGAVIDSNEEQIKTLQKDKSVEVLGNVTILGDAQNAGVVATAEENFYSMGNFEFLEGKLPQAENEIALEVTQLGNFGKEVSVGDIVTVEVNKKNVSEFKSVESSIDIELPDTWEQTLRYLEEQYTDCSFIVTELSEWANAPLGEVYPFSDTRIRTDGSYDQIIVSVLPFVIKDGMAQGTDFLCSKYPKADGTIGHQYRLLNYVTNQQEYTEFDGAIHNTFETVILHGLTVTIKSQFVLVGERSGSPEQFHQDGILANQMISLKRDYVVSGIFQNYTGKWAVKDASVLPNTYLSEAGGRALQDAFYEQTVADTKENQFIQQSYFTVEGPMYATLNTLEAGGLPVEKNLFAYPPYGNNEDVMASGLLGAIFVMELLALLQVFLTQVKKRRRYIGLMKSIAYSNRQVCEMLLWEIVYILKSALPLGILLGFVSSYLAKWVLSVIVPYRMQFYVNPKMLLFGIFFGIVSVFLGIMIPMIVAIRTPLLQSIMTTPKHKRAKKVSKSKAIGTHNYEKNVKKRHGVGRIFYRYYLHNKGKTVLSFSLTCLAALLLGITIFLNYQAFTPYLEATSMGNPEYEYLLPYTLGKSQLTPLLERFLETDCIQEIEIQQKGLKLEAMAGEKESVMTNLYSVEIDSKRYEDFVGAITTGKVDQKQFEEGKEVFVLQPLTSSEGTITYDKRYANIYQPKEWVNPGDTLKLKTITEMINVETNEFEEVLKEKEVTVAAVIHYFPKENLWPFSESKQECVVVGSKKLMNYLYPFMTGIGKELPADVVLKTQIYHLSRYGETSFYLNLKEDADSATVERLLMGLSSESFATVRNFRAEFEPLRTKALGKSVLYSIFGIASAALLVVILYHIAYARVEQERSRIGVLQAIGVTKRQFYLGYILEGFLSALLSLLLVNGILILLVVITIPGIQVEGLTLMQWMKDFFHYRIDNFPYLFYGILQGIFVLVMTLISYLPVQKIVKQQPIENIQNREMK